MKNWIFSLEQEDCETTLTEPFGEIVSYGFPEKYYNDMDCTWLIKMIQGEIIEIRILYLDIEPTPSCRYVLCILYVISLVNSLLQFGISKKPIAHIVMIS